MKIEIRKWSKVHFFLNKGYMEISLYETSKVDCIYQHQSVLYRFVVVVS